MTAIDDWERAFLSFMDSKNYNLWVEKKGISVYLRKSTRIRPNCKKMHNPWIKCIDIATVTITPSGRGTFRKVLDIVEGAAIKYGHEAVYIEFVCHERFANFLRRAGYIEAGATGLPTAWNLIKTLRPAPLVAVVL